MPTLIPIPRTLVVMLMLVQTAVAAQQPPYAQAAHSGATYVALTSDGRSERNAGWRDAEQIRAEDQARALEDKLRAIEERMRGMRVNELELRTAVERAELEGHTDKGPDLLAALLDAEYQLQRTRIDHERVAQALLQQIERRELNRMTDRLEYVANWRDVAFDGPQAVTMATQSIIELLAGNGDIEGAAGRLEELLSEIKDRGSRTAIRFALKDVYTELGRVDRAVEHMVRVVIENAGIPTQ